MLRSVMSLPEGGGGRQQSAGGGRRRTSPFERRGEVSVKCRHAECSLGTKKKKKTFFRTKRRTPEASSRVREAGGGARGEDRGDGSYVDALLSLQ
eukprot:7598470-Pyramimonas_sp.AAC.1